MSLLPLEEIGEEVHHLDQFFRFEAGEGMVVLDGVEHPVKKDDAVVIPEGVKHNIINTSKDMPLKVYTIYAPPQHEDGTVHHTKAEADAAEEHFSGHTSE
jgi:mannose-6-phosphate isomerase-like protein (cupin superfamily)